MTIVQDNAIYGEQGRMVFIDVLRGIAILLVVFWHFDYFHDPFPTTILSRLTMPWRMPLFFFISGFLIYSPNYTLSLFGRRAANRIVCQLLPTILFFLLFVAYKDSYDIIQALRFSDKAGYWFTFVIVVVFFVEAGMLMLFRRIGMRTIYKALTFMVLSAGIFVMYRVVFNDHPFWGSSFSTTLSLPYIVGYLPFSLLGAVVRMYWGRIPSRLMLWPAIAAVAVFIYFYRMSYTPGRNLILALAGITVMCYAAWQMVNLCGTNIAVRILQRLGSLTLEIYLLHYFVVHFAVNCKPLAAVLSGPYQTIRYAVACAVAAALCVGFLKLLDLAGIRNLIFPKKASRISIRFRSKEIKLFNT